MKFLNLDHAFTILKLTEDVGLSDLLEEQVTEYLDHSPNLIVDVDSINFNSMLIGEILNLRKEFLNRWENHRHKFALANVTDFSQDVFWRVKLHEVFGVYGSIQEAMDSDRGADPHPS